ncbi:hypothetical protein BU26DRAFT_559415 [Trematosphaeria pertusa]|uniref:Uncharacterized protein n=1 Tax=Trematosphaeria pertusa TaxID=390896 RepID=A0A6A6IWL7_9PLEO|nr:uncharacterized protein BU26DRAFT_559415 [Trematosphaeria pertusa]KAF2254756.1 hypothetical protein BU26DRAFT_559415 [Trematosphaeria pertusa]
MKLSALIVLVAASVALASPPANSLERSFKVSRDASNAIQQTPCIECKCNGFDGTCTCIPNGCCCT